MAELTDDQKDEIVSMLAAFRKPAAIVAYFQEHYDLELTFRQVGGYDPNRSYYAGGDRLRDLFDLRRKAYLEEVATVPIANQGFRLNVLNEMLAAAIEENKPGTALAVLEQAAKEVGGLLTNQRELKVDDNRRLKPAEMSPEDRKLAIAELIRRALEGRAPPAPGLPTPEGK